MEGAYKKLGNIERQSMYLREALIGGTEIVSAARGLGDPAKVKKLASQPKEQLAQMINDLYKDYVPTLDQKVLPAMLDIVRQRVDANRVAPIFDLINKSMVATRRLMLMRSSLIASSPTRISSCDPSAAQCCRNPKQGSRCPAFE